MSSVIEITPAAGPISGTVRPPGSKSITNRALVLAALADGVSELSGALDSQDTQVMLAGLRAMGLEIAHDASAGTLRVVGCRGRPPAGSAELFLENSGTSLRFLTALCALGIGRFRLDGNARMRERPIGELVAALRQLGADVSCALGNDCPPVALRARGLRGGATKVGGTISSQYLSALLMVAPAAKAPVSIEVAGQLVSQPYVEMTRQMMQAFGIEVRSPSPDVYEVQPAPYRARQYAIEPDASAASYFFGAAAVTGGTVTVLGLSRGALQGDVAFVEALARMGCEVEYGADQITLHGKALQGIDIDMNAISDTAQTLAAVAPFATGPTRIRNIAHVRHKETDRIAAVATELRRLGQTVEEHDDGLTIHPGPIQPATIETYDDHRMAMSFALAGLRATGIRIANPGCTQKTYPGFFADLERLVRGSGAR